MTAVRLPGQEIRPTPDGKSVLDPTITGRGWCDRCGEITARQEPDGTWRHGWCSEGISFGAYFRYRPSRRHRNDDQLAEAS